MSIPKYSDFYQPVLKCLSDGAVYSKKSLKEFCIKELSLTDEDIKEVFENGTSVLLNRLGWALTYLKKAGLVLNPQRSMYQLTTEGIRTARADLPAVDSEYLKRYDSFQAFISHNGQNKETAEVKINENTESPQETINSAISKINAALADDLMAEVMKMDPYEFERLVIKVLGKMGYGASEYNMTTQKSRDEGIDGVITEDHFGFSKIYIQVKQWSADHPVSRPEIQRFLGALAGQGGTKGLFITTSDFTSGAVDFVKKQLNQKIALVNGKQFMDLMIQYNVGVSVESVFEVKRIDYDFFTEDN